MSKFFKNRDFGQYSQFLKDWKIVLYVFVLFMIMVASSHKADEKVHKIALLNNEIKELRSIMVEKRRELMFLKMESTISEKMNKKGLEISLDPPKKNNYRITGFK